MNKIKVIIPFYNPGDFLETCVASVLTQKYDNFEVLFINDCSTDGSAKKYVPRQLPKLNENNKIVLNADGQVIFENSHPILDITKCKTVNLWETSQYTGSVMNIHRALVDFCLDDNDIVFIINGSGYLTNKNVLEQINKIYKDNPNINFVYGKEKNWKGSCYNEEDFNRGINKSPFKLSYPISFRKKVYSDLLKKDSKCNFSKNSKGDFLRYKFEIVIIFSILNNLNLSQVFFNEKEIFVRDKDYKFSEEYLFTKECDNIYKEIYNK